MDDKYGGWVERFEGRNRIPVYNKESFEGMRQAGALAKAVLDYITPFIEAEVKTETLDQKCHDFILSHNAIPAPLGYKGFPKSVCVSTNHVVCHGIPSAKTLKKGDILNIDVTVIFDGWYGDVSRMFSVGRISSSADKLIKATQEALKIGIEAAIPGAYLGEIGKAIHDFIESQGFSVVRDFCGHGIGRIFHDAPQVLHFETEDMGPVLQPGMFFTIEPMINLGRWEVKTLSDGWTVVTRDKKLSAQFEHTIGITETGREVFTQ
jgi:methionyl aminopeptidase